MLSLNGAAFADGHSEGLAFAAGRPALLAKNLAQQEVGVAFIQESPHPGRLCPYTGITFDFAQDVRRGTWELKFGYVMRSLSCEGAMTTVVRLSRDALLRPPQ